MANAAFRDVSFMLRRSHNEQVAKILSDPEASDNDKYVALTFLRNAEVAAKGVLPFCQDTGTAIIHGEKGQLGMMAYSKNTRILSMNGGFVTNAVCDSCTTVIPAAAGLKEKLEKELAFLKEKQAAFVFTGYEFADENGKGTGKIVRVPATITYKEALKNTTIFTSTVMFDMEQLSKEQVQMPQIKSEDTALWWRILREGYVACGLDQNLVKYRRAGKSLSSNKLEALRRIWNLYRKAEGMSVPKSAWHFCFWAVRAVKRRV